MRSKITNWVTSSFKSLKIKELKNIIKEREESIEFFLVREFNFGLEKFEKDKEKNFFEIGFLSISRSSLIRLSPYFHTENKLEDKVWVPINRIFNLSGGKRVPKGETFSDEKTDYFYLKPNEVSI